MYREVGKAPRRVEPAGNGEASWTLARGEKKEGNKLTEGLPDRASLNVTSSGERRHARRN